MTTYWILESNHETQTVIDIRGIVYGQSDAYNVNASFDSFGSVGIASFDVSAGFDSSGVNSS